MPTLYSYATDEVDGTIFDNIQRRIAHTENASSFRMSEYPPKDITDGKADKFIEVLIENTYTLDNAVNAYADLLKMDRDLLTYETTKADSFTALKQNIKGNIRGVYLIEAEVGKFERKMTALKQSFPYVSLTNFLDFRTAYDTLTTSLVGLIEVGNDLLRFLREDGLIKTKGYAEVIRDPEGFNPEGSTKLYRRKLTDKNLTDKMKEIARRPEYYMEENPYNYPEINDRNRVDLINKALRELGEMDFIYNPDDTSFKDKDYTLFYNRLNRIKDARQLALQLDKINKRKIIERKKLEKDKEKKRRFDEEYEDYRIRMEDYVPFEPEGVSYDEEGNVAFEPEEEEEEEEELPDEDILDRNIGIREEGMRELLIEERELFEGIKLMSDLLKKINEPFAKVWAKLINTITEIDEDMKDILNSFNEFRQQTLNNPKTADEENEDLLNNPYGKNKMKGSGFADMMDNTRARNYDSGVSLKNEYSGLSHPSRREMARYYGAGGSKYI